jgi:formylglycine-generating enzyme required for sulfatase activity
MTPPPERSQLFISYSHKDREWVDRLRTMIKPLEQRYGLERWDDSRIQAGMVWREEIEKALASAQVALLLVSADFLASEFVTWEELPELFHAAKQEGLRILWVPLRPCLWRDIPEIEQYQAAIPPGRTLGRMTEVEQEEAFVQIAEEIKKVFREEAERQARDRKEEEERLAREKEALERRADQERMASEEAERRSQKAELQAREEKERQQQGQERLAREQHEAVYVAPAKEAPVDQLPETTLPEPLLPINTTQGVLMRDGNSWRVEKRPLEVAGFREELTEGVALTMVKIPAGTFLKGSPPDEPERSDDEGPQHKVSLGPFFLVQSPITQAQWLAVASWEKVERDLLPDPSKFKGTNRPVEQLSWWDAVEFCRRLSQRTGKCYGLPSEAQWEYTCRAGSITPFHFGATLTPELANYKGGSSYDNGPTGIFRKQTTDVASFPANSWGLQDMHGNVWEWCEDHWHSSYDFAPEDGQPWLIPAAGTNEQRLLRGGCWNESPSRCRSAFRMSAPPELCINSVGFRVCCLPPGSTSQP